MTLIFLIISIRLFFAKNVLPNVTRESSGRGSAGGKADEAPKDSFDDNLFTAARDKLAVELLRTLVQLEAEQPGMHSQLWLFLV